MPEKAKGESMKKAQGLSMNYVIVGIIALVVLVVIILIFTTGMREPAEMSRDSPEYAARNACDLGGGVWSDADECPTGKKQILEAQIRTGVCCEK